MGNSSVPRGIRGTRRPSGSSRRRARAGRELVTGPSRPAGGAGPQPRAAAAPAGLCGVTVLCPHRPGPVSAPPRPVRWPSSGQGPPGCQSPGRAVIAWRNWSLFGSRGLARQTPCAVSYCHGQGCVTNQPTATAPASAQESGPRGPVPSRPGGPAGNLWTL